MIKYQLEREGNNYSVTDNINGVIMTFTKGKLNETQNITITGKGRITEDLKGITPEYMAHVLRLLTEWIVNEHPEALE